MLKKSLIGAVILLCAQQVFYGAILEDFETLENWKKMRYKSIPEKAPDAAVGEGALQINTPALFQKTYKCDWTKRLDWDKKYKGISFWVKGDGSNQWGSISLGGNWGWGYIYYFPVKNKEWEKISVPFNQFTPKGDITQLIGSRGGLPPSGISTIGFGDRWKITHRNSRIPKFTYCIDQVELIEDIPNGKESGKKYKPRKFTEVVELLKKGKDVVIFCLGDSITAGTGLKNPDKERYANLLQKKLREHFKRENITVQSRAVGGARTDHSIAWVNRDFADKTPDLITYMIGYNNKSAAYSPEVFKNSLERYIDAVTTKTRGKTAILLIPTIPGLFHRFEMMDDYADMTRQVAKERNIPVCDIQKEFKKIGKVKFGEYMKGMAHPNYKGHKYFADKLTEFIIK